MTAHSSAFPSPPSAEDLEDRRISRHAILLFDGVCSLCNGFVNFVIDRDPEGYFKLGALQSDAARPYLDTFEQDLQGLDTMVLIEDGKLYTRSSAALRVLRRLNMPWSLLYGFILVPKGLRDWIYEVVASHRYEWFGQRDQCRRPTPELRQRFLEEVS